MTKQKNGNTKLILKNLKEEPIASILGGKSTQMK
jgi:hypothetical protein